MRKTSRVKKWDRVLFQIFLYDLFDFYFIGTNHLGVFGVF